MKQKNLILVAVAVGCGLVAAFLTTQLGAKPASTEQYDVPVAAKDLAVGTKLSKDEIDTLIVFKKLPKDALPPAYAATKEELADKRLTRTIRSGETFNPADLTTNVAISPPPGKDMMSIRANAESAVAGFAGPGSRVNILATVKLRNTDKGVTFPLLTDMLVLAIDSNTQLPGRDQAFSNLNTVSLAVDAEEQLLLHAAINRGADLRLVLRNPDKPSDVHPMPREEIKRLLADEPNKGAVETKTGPELVKVPVALEDLPAGTQLTAEVIAKKFKMAEYPAPVPASFIKDLKEHEGRYLLKDLAGDLYVPRSFIGEKPTPAAPLAEKAPEPKPKSEPKEYWDTTVQTSTGTKKYRYEKTKDGEYKYVGEVRDDEKPESKPAEEKKPEGTPA